MKNTLTPHNVLVIAERPAFPAIDGARLRIVSILRALQPYAVNYVHLHEPGEEFVPVERKLAHCTTLASFPQNAQLTQWSRFRSVFSTHTNGVLRHRNQLLHHMLTRLPTNEYSFILFCGLNMAQYTTCLRSSRLLIDLCDSEPRHMEARIRFVRDPLKKLYFSWQRVKVLAELHNLSQRIDLWLVISEAERESLSGYLPLARIATIPNSVEPMDPSSGVPVPNLLVLSGNFDYFPNIDAALYFVRAIFPRIISTVPGCRLRILGKNPPCALTELTSDTVEVTGFTAHFHELLREASIYICPLRLGTGVKNKVLEAMAAGLPIVSSSVGIEGIGAEAGEHCLVADCPAEFARCTVRLLQDGELRNSLGRAARELVARRLGSQSIRDKLARAITDSGSALVSPLLTR